MSIDTFGYNGVLQLSSKLVNKLLAAQAYEKFLVEANGQIVDGEFIGPIDIPAPPATVRLFLRTGRPTMVFSNHDGSNGAALTVPFVAIGIYLLDAGAEKVVEFKRLLALTINNVRVIKTDAGLTIDFSQIASNDIQIGLISVKPGPTGTGGTTAPPFPLDDKTINGELAKLNVGLTAATLRDEISKRLKGGTLGPPTNLPVAIGGADSALKAWDLFLFDDAGGGSADLMLYQDNLIGQGNPTEAIDTIPGAPSPPSFEFAVSIRADVLINDIERIFDATTYFKQGTGLNTPANTGGYMVVPPKGVDHYALPTPGGAGAVTIAAPVNGVVPVTIAPGALAARSRARLKTDAGGQADFIADSNGGASISIPAAAGARLTVEVYAVSTPSDSSVILWRPQVQFQDGGLKVKFHFYKYIDNWCDAEGDGWLLLALVVDRNSPFRLRPQVVNSEFGLPWWLSVIGFFGGNLLGDQVASWLSQLLLQVVAEKYVKDSANPKIQSGLDNTFNTLNAELAGTSPKDAAIFLEEADVFSNGVELSGYGDAGAILGYGRTVGSSTATGVTIIDPGLFFALYWNPQAGPLQVQGNAPVALITDSAKQAFWTAGYDDLPTGKAFSHSAFPLAAGERVMVWLTTQDSVVKILLERPAAPSTEVFVTWVAFRERLAPSLKIVNHITTKVVSSNSSAMFQEDFYSYSGTLTAEAKKFFLTTDTQAAGQEHWYWDDQEVTEAGLAQSGGQILLDAANRQLLVTLDQSGLGNLFDGISEHWVRFEATDVFGLTLKTKIRVDTPSMRLRYHLPTSNNPLGFRIPLGDRARLLVNSAERAQLEGAIRSLLANTVGANGTSSDIAASLVNALTTGSASLGADSAATILSALADKNLVGGRT